MQFNSSYSDKICSLLRLEIAIMCLKLMPQKYLI